MWIFTRPMTLCLHTYLMTPSVSCIWGPGWGRQRCGNGDRVRLTCNAHHPKSCVAGTLWLAKAEDRPRLLCQYHIPYMAGGGCGAHWAHETLNCSNKIKKRPANATETGGTPDKDVPQSPCLRWRATAKLFGLHQHSNRNGMGRQGSRACFCPSFSSSWPS